MEVSAEEGARDLAVCFALLESSLLGRTIKVQDVFTGKTGSYEKDINRNYKI